MPNAVLLRDETRHRALIEAALIERHGEGIDRAGRVPRRKRRDGRGIESAREENGDGHIALEMPLDGSLERRTDSGRGASEVRYPPLGRDNGLERLVVALANSA